MPVILSQAGPLDALLSRPFSLPATALLVAAKFSMNAVIVLVEHICTAFYIIPSYVAVPVSLVLLVWQFLTNARDRRVDGRRAMVTGSGLEPLVTFYGKWANTAPTLEPGPKVVVPQEKVTVAVERAKAEALAALRQKEQEEQEQKLKSARALRSRRCRNTCLWRRIPNTCLWRRRTARANNLHPLYAGCRACLACIQI